VPCRQREIATLVLVERYTYQEAAAALKVARNGDEPPGRAGRVVADLLLGPEGGAPIVEGAGL